MKVKGESVGRPGDCQIIESTRDRQPGRSKRPGEVLKDALAAVVVDSAGGCFQVYGLHHVNVCAEDRIGEGGCAKQVAGCPGKGPGQCVGSIDMISEQGGIRRRIPA